MEELIVSDPNIMMGKPTIKGTRITVELILEHLGNGESIDELLDGYPFLVEEQVRAALLFGAKALSESFVYPTAS